MVVQQERAGPEDVGQQALIRGFYRSSVFRPGLSLSDVGRRSTIGHIDETGAPLPWSRPHCCTRCHAETRVDARRVQVGAIDLQ
jgi:hypothetical protein